eukprot:TRINITY_DN5114_c0_g1_i1.p1 TRINITY_DN5114_c0_g1~~TRINITY_DN5114_c0_g1_i1.p1  ORF type:complete len:1148 (+),score=346.07 TRINITY_DN5114_c0_g1_i1:316-3759(+)
MDDLALDINLDYFNLDGFGDDSAAAGGAVAAPDFDMGDFSFDVDTAASDAAAAPAGGDDAFAMPDFEVDFGDVGGGGASALPAADFEIPDFDVSVPELMAAPVAAPVPSARPVPAPRGGPPVVPPRDPMGGAGALPSPFAASSAADAGGLDLGDMNFDVDFNANAPAEVNSAAPEESIDFAMPDFTAPVEPMANRFRGGRGGMGMRGRGGRGGRGGAGGMRLQIRPQQPQDGAESEDIQSRGALSPPTTARRDQGTVGPEDYIYRHEGEIAEKVYSDLADRVPPAGAGDEKFVLATSLVDGSTKKLYAVGTWTVQNLLHATASKHAIWMGDLCAIGVLDPTTQAIVWPNPADTLNDVGITAESQVVLDLKFVKHWRCCPDPAAQRLYYLRAKNELLSGRCYCSHLTAVRLAAAHVHATFGAHVPTKHRLGFLRDTITNYLPQRILDETPHQYLEARIFQLHAKLVHLTQEQAEQRYVEISQGLQLYGVTMFEAQNGDVRFAVAEDGLFMSREDDPDFHRFTFHPFPEILTWRSSPNGMEVVLKIPTGKKLEFEMPQSEADRALSLLSGYYLYLKPADFKNILPSVNPLPNKPTIENASELDVPSDYLRRIAPDAIESRLDVFRKTYIERSNNARVPVIDRILFTVDDALGEGLVLDNFDLSKSNVTNRHLSVLADAFDDTKQYLPPEEKIDLFEENMNIVTFNLTDCILPMDTIDPLGKIIATQSFKQYLLKRTGITHKYADAIGNYLEKNQSIERLDLEGNPIGFRGVSKIVKSMKHNPVLTSLNFSRCGLNEKVSMFMQRMFAANNKIVHINLSHNKVGDTGMATMVVGMFRNKSLRYLDFSNTGMGAKGGSSLMKWLSGSYQVRGYNIAGNSIGTSGGNLIAKYLGQPNGLVVLNLKGCNIGAKATGGILEQIKTNKSIRTLNLAENPIDKKGQAVLGELFRFNSTLKRVDVSHCGLATATLTQMAQTLRNNRSLNAIGLGGHKNMNEVSVIQDWTPSLKESSLNEIDLSGCGLTAASLNHLADGINLGEITVLTIDHNKMNPASLDAITAMLSNNTDLQTLNMQHCDLSPDLFTHFLKGNCDKNTTLQRLDVTHNSLLGRDWTPALNSNRAHCEVLFVDIKEDKVSKGEVSKAEKSSKKKKKK